MPSAVNSKKALYVVTLYRKYTRALACQNFHEAAMDVSHAYQMVGVVPRALGALGAHI
jgi:hypothetical protein